MSISEKITTGKQNTMVYMLSNWKNAYEHYDKKTKRLSNRQLAGALRLPWRGSYIVSFGYCIGSFARSSASDIITQNKKKKGESTMRHRARTKRKVDRRIFARTGMQTKKMNVSPRILRGGIML